MWRGVRCSHMGVSVGGWGGGGGVCIAPNSHALTHAHAPTLAVASFISSTRDSCVQLLRRPACRLHGGLSENCAIQGCSRSSATEGRQEGSRTSRDCGRGRGGRAKIHSSGK